MDQQAFLEDAIERYGKAAYNYAYRLTQNDADARDLTQDAFVRVYRAWRSFKPGTSFRSWIYRILTNLHRDELRRRKGRYPEELPSDDESHARNGRPLAVEPIEEYVDGYLSEPVSRALAALPAEQRRIVLLADIDDLSYQEIAEIVGCSIGTIRSRLHRARGQLRTLVTRYSEQRP
ncbi:MAG: sigma-70 family RNA polymerase sigma factor [Candidatus Eremiobacteraeota bacterium]|nr:sigma-70 family RNA polymerase sigma factor [Candidatus Eremiobacteraeota bacterium]